MQYPSIAFPGDFLDRETERQQRLQQEARKALEQKKALLRGGESTKRSMADEAPLQRPGQSTQAASPAPNTTASATDSATDSIERLRSIPEIRSALIPIDIAVEGDQWSKPFLLSKADVEPWISYLQGYHASRLFPGGNQSELPTIDVAVQALLQLKGVDPRYILQPIVQINQPAEFLDLGTELRNCRDRVQAKALTTVANDVHEAQLVKAVEKGRELGDNLYHALVGEGFSNLIRAWERVYKRKPTINELHLMLTNGSVRVMPDAPSAPPPELRPRPAPERASQAAVAKQMVDSVPQAASFESLSTKPATPKVAPPAAKLRTVVADGVEDQDVATLFTKPPRLARWQKIALQLLHVALCGAAITAYFLIV
jgi:hypothetical protein